MFFLCPGRHGLFYECENCERSNQSMREWPNNRDIHQSFCSAIQPGNG